MRHLKNKQGNCCLPCSLYVICQRLKVMSTEPKWWLLSARNGIIDERSAYKRNAHVMGSFNDPFIENWVICNESLVKSKKTLFRS